MKVNTTKLVDRAAQYGRNRVLTKKLIELGEEGLLTAADRAQLAHLVADTFAAGYLACVEDVERGERAARGKR